MLIKALHCLLIVGFCLTMSGQSVLESSTFKFLNIPGSARHNYLGKSAIAVPDEHIDLVLANPALLEFNSKGKLMASSSLYFQSLYGHLAYSMNNYKFDIPYVVGVNFINYGKQRRIDIDGNDLGTISPSEISTYIAASKTYEHYKFGATVKLAYANYFVANMAGVSADLSMLYRDDKRDIYATLLLKNIGYQFIGDRTQTNMMPFDIQFAISKKFKHNPLRFILMTQELYHWNAATTTEEGRGYGLWPQNNLYRVENPSILAAIMSHFVFGAEVNFGQGFKIGTNYDIKKGMENSFDNMRGLTGLGLGFGIYSRKFDIGYSFSKFSPISVNHTFTFTMKMSEWLRR